MPKALITRENVNSVLAGLWASGKPRLRQPMSFPKAEEVRAALREFVLRVGGQLRCAQPAFDLSDEQITLLISKIASWLVATQRLSAREIDGLERECDLLVAVTLHQPTWMLRCGVSTALSLGQQRATRRAVIANHSPPPLVWEGPCSRIVEMKTATHLIEQGTLAGNCLGTCRDGQVFRPEARQQNAPQLRYLRMILSGRYRIFALRGRSGESLATIEYQTKQRCISNFEVTEGANITRSDALSDVFGAFAAVGVPLDVVVQGYRRVVDGYVDEPLWDVDAVGHSLSTTTMTVGPRASRTVLRRLTGCRQVSVDISALPPERLRDLPPIVASDLLSNGSHWPVGLVVVAGMVHFPGVRTGDFSQLALCGHTLSLPSLVEGCFPRLRAVRGSMLLNALQRGAFPCLEIVGQAANFGALPTSACPLVWTNWGGDLPEPIRRDLANAVSEQKRRG